MAASYGEHLLANTERRVRFRMALRRLALLVPGLAVVMLAMLELLGARQDRLAANGVGGLRAFLDPVLPGAWTILFVLLPLVAALKPVPLPIGAPLALLAGPILTPVLFGAGGWRPWQIAVLAAICALVLGAVRERFRRWPE